MSFSPDLSISTLYNVKGKTAVVTGGGSGIGEMMAAALVQNGASVIIASRKEKQLKSVADNLNKTGPGKCEYIIANLSNKAGVDALVSEIKKRVDKIHILVNNSGATFGAPWTDVPEKAGWDRVMDLNVKAIFYLTVGLSDLLAKNSTNLDPGRVVNISSISSIDAKAEGSQLSQEGHGIWSYNTSKAAANQLTLTMAVSLAKQYITVNAILPGLFPSKMTAFGIKHAGDVMAASHPMGRMGTPQDMAGILLFLVSPASAHISGVLIPIDGGAFLSGGGFSRPAHAKL